MSGIVDGVSKIWALDFKHKALNLTGFKNNEEALLYFVRVVANEACTKETKFAFTEDAAKRIRDLVDDQLSKCLEDE